jgi:hypothetical protein
MRNSGGRSSESSARTWFGLIAAITLVGLVIQVAMVWNNNAGHFATPASRIFNLLFFFTILSNIITMITSGLLYQNLHRSSTIFRVSRLSGLVGIIVTGIIYHAALSELSHLKGWDSVANVILHYVVPITAVLGWLAFGPRGMTTIRIVGLSIIYPVAYCAVTLIRGPIVDWYPYPFMDVTAHGYGRVAVNCVFVAVLVVAVAFVIHRLDGWMAKRIPTSVQA